MPLHEKCGLGSCRWRQAPTRRCTCTRDYFRPRGARSSRLCWRFDMANDVLNRTPAEIVTPCPKRRRNSIDVNLRYTRGSILLDHLHYVSSHEKVGFDILHHFQLQRIPAAIPRDFAQIVDCNTGIWPVDSDPAISLPQKIIVVSSQTVQNQYTGESSIDYRSH